jgi:hypothetical protein
MLVYRTQTEEIEPALELARLRAAPCTTHEEVVDLLIRLGQIESAIGDWLFPQADDEGWTAQTLRRASFAVGHAFRASLSGRYDEQRAWIARLRGVLDQLAGCQLPRSAGITVPEGYAYYGLYPEMYFEAALSFYQKARPDRAVVIGIRSIGASLSAVVGAALEDLGCELDSWTVRPRGHPFDRTVALAPGLERRIGEWRGAHFAIVDEGPGLSGSSLTSVAAKLSEMGVPDDRIAFFPSWLPDGAAFRSEAARERWRMHARYAVAFEDVRRFPATTDISGGKWRERFCDGATWPAVQPQHERRKYLGADFVARFAGLGRFGRAKLARAERLAAEGFSPEPFGLDNGFLRLRLVRGRTPEVDRDLLGAMARYMQFLGVQPAAAGGASFDELTEMIEVNTAGARSLGCFRGAVEDAKPVAIDGRMLPHEWLRTESCYVKTDSLDHHDDHFFPGPQDIAWDLAGACIEWNLDDRETEYLAARCGDPGLAARLPFYRTAYLAFRIGYVALAREAIAGTADADRFAALERRYRAKLPRCG